MNAQLWPTSLRAENLALVTQLLEQLGVPFLVHAPRARTSTAVMVSAEHRGLVSRALSTQSTWRGAKVVGTGPVPPLLELDSSAATSELRKTGTFAVVGPSQFAHDHAVDRLRYAVEVEFWFPDAFGYLRSPRWGRVQTVIDQLTPDTRASLADLGRFHDHTDPAQLEQRFPARSEFLVSAATDCLLPIDVVYTWVDGRDEQWQRRRHEQRGAGADWHAEVASDSRYLERDELRYSVRSVLAHAPWVGRIHIATDRQRPAWLPEDTDRVRIVDHRDFFAHPDVLPVFNSHAIESQLHRIDGLPNHFVYLNDDVLFGAPVDPEDLVSPAGLTAIHLGRAKVPIPEYPELRRPVDAAFRNVRRLIERDFQRTLTATSWHTPHPLRVDVLAEMADRYAPEWDRTEASRFRSPEDISPTSSFYQHYSWFTGRSFTGSLTYSYTNLAAADMVQRLGRLAAMRSFQSMCLNDSDAHPEETMLVDQALREFFEDYFPIAGSHEADR